MRASGPLESLLARIPGRAVVVLFSGWIASLVVVAVLLNIGHDIAHERVQRSTIALSRIVQENIGRVFQSVDITLASVADAYRLAAPLARHDPKFRALLQARLYDLADVRALFVVGVSGYILHDTDYPQTPDVSLADRPYFAAHVEDPTLRRAVSRPLLSRSGTGYFVAHTHRLGTASNFQGIVVAAIQAGRFERLFSNVPMGDDIVIALFHRTGELIARFPSDGSEAAKSFAQFPLFAEHLPRADAGSFITTRSISPGRRVVSYRAVDGTPLVVYVSRGLEAGLEEWRRTAMAAAIAVAALTFLLSVFIVRLVRDSRVREQERLRSAQAEKLEALGQLTAGIAHDFGNIVNIVSINLELLRMLPPAHPARTKALDTAQQAAARAVELISRLLDFARSQPIQAMACDVNEHVLGSKDLLVQAAGSDVEVSLELASDLPRVVCDPGQLQVALVNLVVNASHAMGGRGVVRLITARSESENRGVQALTRLPVYLAIRDSGQGMTEEIRRRVLEPFFTTKGGGGTGLGLTQVYGFMQRIGGDMRIESAPGAGTTVYLYFPAV
jgi:signal transduction histidine kinase